MILCLRLEWDKWMFLKWYYTNGQVYVCVVFFLKCDVCVVFISTRSSVSFHGYVEYCRKTPNTIGSLWTFNLEHECSYQNLPSEMIIGSQLNAIITTCPIITDNVICAQHSIFTHTYSHFYLLYAYNGQIIIKACSIQFNNNPFTEISLTFTIDIW